MPTTRLNGDERDRLTSCRSGQRWEIIFLRVRMTADEALPLAPPELRARVVSSVNADYGKIFEFQLWRSDGRPAVLWETTREELLSIPPAWPANAASRATSGSRMGSRCACWQSHNRHPGNPTQILSHRNVAQMWVKNMWVNENLIRNQAQPTLPFGWLPRWPDAERRTTPVARA